VGPPLIRPPLIILSNLAQLDYHYSLSSSKCLGVYADDSWKKDFLRRYFFFSQVLGGSGPSAQMTRIAIILYPSRIVLVTRRFQRKIYCLFRSCDSGWNLTPDLGVPGLADLHIRSRYASRYQWTSPFSQSGVSTLRNIFRLTYEERQLHRAGREPA